MRKYLLLLLLLLVGVSLFPAKEKNIPIKSTQQVNVNNPNEIEYAKHLLYRLDAEISPSKLYRMDSLRGNYDDKNNYYQLFITNLKTNEMRRFYAGDFRTSGWEWTPDNNIKITYNCGTGCEATIVMSINETFLLSDDENGQMSEKNRWKFETYSSFTYNTERLNN